MAKRECFKIKRIGQSAAERRKAEGSTTIRSHGVGRIPKYPPPLWGEDIVYSVLNTLKKAV